jgi:hypothetical protein
VNAQIYGSVIDWEKVELADVKLYFFLDDSLIQRTKTNLNGTYRIACLDSGIYKVLVKGPWHEEFETFVLIKDDETLQLETIKLPESVVYVDICWFPCYNNMIHLDPFGGPTVIEAEDNRQR